MKPIKPEIMNTFLKLVALSIVFSVAGCTQTPPDPSKIARESLDVAARQLAQSMWALRIHRTYGKKTGVITC